MKEMKARTEQAAREEARKHSEGNGGAYVLVTACFGLFMEDRKRLGVHAPSDSVFGWYAHKGRVKSFTDAQQIADQNATPVLS